MTLHSALTGAELHETKGAAAATLGQILTATGAATATYQNLFTQVVRVNALGDLPAASGGKITLAASTAYVFGANVNIGTDFLQFSDGSSIEAFSLFSASITYTGTGSMCVGVDVNALVQNITLICATAQVFDFSETSTGGLKIFQADTVIAAACTKFATLDKLQSNLIVNCAALNTTLGIEVKGSVSLVTSILRTAMLGTSTTLIGVDFGTSVQQTVEIDNCLFVGGVGSVGINGAAASANVTTNFIANVTSTSFANVTTPLTGITVDDIRWSFQGNGVVEDTMPDALTAFVANATVTTTPVGVPTLVAGTYVEERASQFTTTAAGRVTYNGERDLVTPIDVSVVLDPASGTNKTFRVYVALNGTAITASGIAVNISAGDPKQISVPWQAKLSTADFIEIFVENETDSVNVTAIDTTLRIR